MNLLNTEALKVNEYKRLLNSETPNHQCTNDAQHCTHQQGGGPLTRW